MMPRAWSLPTTDLPLTYLLIRYGAFDRSHLQALDLYYYYVPYFFMNFRGWFHKQYFHICSVNACLWKVLVQHLLGVVFSILLLYIKIQCGVIPKVIDPIESWEQCRHWLVPTNTSNHKFYSLIRWQMITQ